MDSKEFISEAAKRYREFGIARLVANADVDFVESNGLSVFYHDSFLSRDECDHLIGLIIGDPRPSTVYEGTEIQGYRTSFTCHFDPSEDVVRRVDDRICSLLGIDCIYGEPLQGQMYAPGQQFKTHHDFFYTDQPYWDFEKPSGQRTWTAMVYLNDAEGGETRFPKAGLEFVPNAGVLLAWSNVDQDGRLDFMTAHAGRPVASGVKYIITKWFREVPFVASARAAPTVVAPR